MSNKLKFQWAKAAAMFSNYQEIIKNWGLAVNSMGFTDNQVKNQMDSLSRRINKLKADLTGMVAQGGSSGLTEWLKECVSELDRFAKFLSSVSASTYSTIGSMVKLAGIMYTVNKVMRMIRTSSVAAKAGLATMGVEGAASMSILRAAVESVGAAFKRILPVLIVTTVIEGISYLVDSTNSETEAIQKQSDAMIDNVAAKRQEIETYSQQEDFLDALFTAHQKLTAEIESSTTSDEKKKKLLEDRIETENQMAKVVGWSAVQQMQADDWTDESTKKVRDDYKKATDDKKKALAQFIAAKQEEAIANYENATKNMENWKQETHEFCLGMSDRIKSIKDYTDSIAIAYAVLAKFDEIRASAADDRIKDLEESKRKLSELAADPNHTWTEGNSKYYNDVSNQLEEAKAEKEKISKSLYNARYQAEFHESGEDIQKKYEAAQKEWENLGGSGLTNPGGPIDPNSMLDRWGYGEGAGGDVYNPTPSGHSKHSKTGHKQKDPKEDWQYGDTTSQMFAELSKKFEAAFGTKNGLDMATLTAIVTKLTGINTLEFDGVSDPFGTGGRNTWESGRLFYEKMAPYLAQGLSVPEALGHLTPGITEQEWRTWLNDKALFLRNHYDYNKNDQRFSDPNEQPGGLYDLGGYSGTVSTGGESYVGSDADEAHLWDVAVMAASEAKVVKDPRWYWLIMMHESGRGKDPTAVANHNYAGIGDGAGVDMINDKLFSQQFAATLDGMFKSAPNNIGELVYGMYSHGYFTGDAEAYQSDLNGINNEGLIGGSSGSNSQTSSASAAPIGDAVYDEALKESAERKGEALGANTCAAFVSYVTRGIGANTGIDSPLVKNWVDSAQSRGAWVDASSGQAAPKGSLVVWSREGEPDGNPWMHIGISDGQEGWISSDTHGLKHHTGLDSYYSGNGYNYAGYIDMSKLTGGQTVAGYATPKKPSFWNGRKSTLADFTRDQIAETIYDQERQQKLYEAQKKNIEYQMKIHGNTYELLRASDANEKAYYEAMEKNRKGWMDTYDDIVDGIEEYVNNHIEVKNKLNGKNVFDMPHDELSKLAELADKNGEFKKLVENLFKVREQLSNANGKLVELRVAKKIRDGYMKPEQDEEYRLKRLEEWYNRTTSNKTDEEKYLDNHELYQSQIDIYKERLKRQKESLKGARRRDQEQLEEYYESLDDFQNGKYNDKGELVEKGLAQYKGDNTDEAKDKIAELKAKVKDVQKNIDQLSKHGSEDFQKLQKDVEDTEAKIREIAEKDDEVTKNLWDTIENDIDDMFFDIIKKGSSFKESWKKLWDDVAKIALQQIMRMTVNRWLFNARTTIDDVISGRNAGKKAATNAGAGLLADGASRFTAEPRRWNQVATGNRYLDMNNGVLNGNYFPMKSNGANLTTSVNKSVQETSKLSSVTQKATSLTSVSNTLTQTATAKDTLNTTATTTQTAATQAQTLQMQALTEALIMAGTPKPSISLGGHAMGGLLTTAYANGGMIHGAGTGKSDSILAYLADKDRFVFLSNGEYVMTAEATQRIGKDNLDAMNYGGFADGGALNPTPYVPQISPRVAKRAEGVRVTNPNARMEQLMQEQTDTIKNMGNSDGSGNVVVLNTHASSDDVMNAIQRNPRAFQSILHNQKRHGFR
ncbi:hypothetical protein [Mitsuokella jalaludinii]|uniref:hypothetical protein n=1 Tax=Mitsuokella jalaludinii TaxID=187979 RepID=UPI00307A8934